MAYDENWNWIDDSPSYSTSSSYDDWLSNSFDGLGDFDLNALVMQSMLDSPETLSSYLNNSYQAQSDQEILSGLLGGSSPDSTGLLGSLFSGLGSAGSSIVNALKQYSQSGSGVTGNSSAIGNILTGASGLYGAYAQNQLADKQMELAKYVLQNGDPYKDYRTGTEIPMMQQYSNKAVSELGDTDSAYNNAANALGKPLQSLNDISDPTLGTNMFSANLNMDKFNPNIGTNMYGLNDPTVSALQQRVRNANPLGGDYAEYQQKLQQSYDDPLSVYNSPEMQALNDIFRQQIERRDSAAGRNSQYGSRAVEMQNNFLTNALPKYRQDLISSIGTSGQNQIGAYNADISGLGTSGNVALTNNQNLINNQSTVNNALLGQQQNNISQQTNQNNSVLQQQQNNLTGQNQINSALLQLMQNQNTENANINTSNANEINLGSALSNLFGNQSNWSNQLANLAKPGGTAGAGVSQFSELASMSNGANASQYQPLINGLGSIFGNNGNNKTPSISLQLG